MLLTLTWIMRGRRLPLGVGIAPALRRVLVRRGTASTVGEEKKVHESWLKGVKISSYQHLKTAADTGTSPGTKAVQSLMVSITLACTQLAPPVLERQG